ncbi:MAG: D-alanyl-D-alanine carboxypeptidase/D-alanyl-D-alanine-endopeptidase [Chitinophagales bacterium]
MNKIGFLSLLLLFLPTSESFSQKSIGGAEAVNNYVNALKADSDLINASWGFCLMDPVNGTILSAYEKEKSLVPASGVKAITTLVALQLLGPNYTFATKIEYDGTLADGVLKGNIYITGSGDPTLGSNRISGFPRYDTLFAQWADIIQSAGIKKIDGSIVGDASVFDNVVIPGSWNWDDIGQYYGAGVSGLNLYENMYTIYYSSNKSVTKIDSVFPKLEGITFINEVRPEGTGNNAYIFGGPDSYLRTITGTIPPGVKAYKVEGAMPDPVLFAAAELKRCLESKGISVSQNATTFRQMQQGPGFTKLPRKTIHVHKSAPLSAIIKETNGKSINLYAEALLKTIGYEKMKTGTQAASIKAVRNFWTTNGFSLKGFNMEDGSGLSRLNTMTAYQMASFMMFGFKQPDFETYKNSMSVAGVSGTLKNIGAGTVAQGKILAKSGSMYKVRSYTGYVQGKSGKIYTFSIIVNNYTCASAEIKSKIEKLMILMAGLE